MDRADHYEYVEMFFMKKKDVSLPGVCFILSFIWRANISF